MSQILDYFLEPAYGQVCLSSQDAELPWQATFDDRQVVSDETSVTVAVTDEEPVGQVEVEVYQGRDERPHLQPLQRIFSGTLNLMKPGLLLFAPTGMRSFSKRFWTGLIMSKSIVTVIRRRGW
jgi:hypothetical protein